MRVVGVLPAAGHARRLQPLPSSKEVVVVRGRPVMDVLIDRLEAASCDEIRVVTRPEKTDVVAHATARGATVVLARPASVSESLLLGVEGCSADDLVLFGFPDTIWGPPDGFARLVSVLTGDVEVVLGIFRADEPERSDTVGVDGDRVVWIEAKPARPRSRLIWGCAAARARAMAHLVRYAEPGEAFDELAKRGRVAAVRLADPFVDIGTPNRLAELTAEA